ncbi:UGSC family (seleno)protein [Microbacterium lushaniae]|uniref:UGSC-like domain-containing protein n=1 Tax=Microbacterium lushaniae TaxID=2614639 RepID=A0A5J6L3V0_9MICO|nr:UGSC family (seleno)protein [Microbacterium lushaniae]QEW03208.1 hypothetical protein F6J85_08895 [Microbacterium lushaniae]
MAMRIINPTASRATHSAEQSPQPAPRPRELAGLRVGLLENTKRNAAEVLADIGRALAETDRTADLIPYRKEDFALPLPEDFLAEISGTCDVVVIGVGDCGSCSASAVADGIALEALGIPTAVICTEAFEVTSSAMARLKGRADFPFILTPHPVANLDQVQVHERAGTLVDAVRARLLGA